VRKGIGQVRADGWHVGPRHWGPRAWPSADHVREPAGEETLALHNIEKNTGPHLDGIHMLWKSRPQHK
jgi:hypothetical protein